MTLDPAAMARLLEITGDDAAFVDELVDAFIAAAATLVVALRGAPAAGDAAPAVRPAHSLKSNSMNVGATVLAELTGAIEMDGRAGAIPDLAARAAAVETEFAGVREALLAERAAR